MKKKFSVVARYEIANKIWQFRLSHLASGVFLLISLLMSLSILPYFFHFPAYFYSLCFHSSVRYTLISLPRFTPAVQFSAAYLDVKHFSLVIRLLRLHDLAKSKETLVVGKNIQMVIPTCEVKLS